MLRQHASIAAALLFAVSINVVPAAAQAISGADGFWYLGNGILYDGDGCTSAGWCYYAQATYVAIGEGRQASGDPTWTVVEPGSGQITLSCNPCSTTIATAVWPSNPGESDVTLYATYPDGATTPPFNIDINTAWGTQFIAVNNYDAQTMEGGGNPGYFSIYQWYIVDGYGNHLSGFDCNESFGTWYNPVPNNWGYPTRSVGYCPDNDTVFEDTLAAYGIGTPQPVAPESPLGTDLVRYDSYWEFSVFSQTAGGGQPAHVDIQEFYLDHGAHSAP